MQSLWGQSRTKVSALAAKSGTKESQKARSPIGNEAQTRAPKTKTQNFILGKFWNPADTHFKDFRQNCIWFTHKNPHFFGPFVGVWVPFIGHLAAFPAANMVVKSRSTGSGASKSNHPKFPGDQEMRWPGYNVIRFSGDMDVRYSSYDLDVRWQRYQFIRWFQEKLAPTNGKELRIEMIEEERETLSKSIFSPDLSLWAKIGLKKFQYLEAFVFVKKDPGHPNYSWTSPKQSQSLKQIHKSGAGHFGWG